MTKTEIIMEKIALSDALIGRAGDKAALLAQGSPSKGVQASKFKVESIKRLSDSIKAIRTDVKRSTNFMRRAI